MVAVKVGNEDARDASQRRWDEAATLERSTGSPKLHLCTLAAVNEPISTITQGQRVARHVTFGSRHLENGKVDQSMKQ